MRILPFLYLPDAVTLILLLAVFDILRKVAIDHILQELRTLRKEMLLYWLKYALDPRDRGYIAIRDLIDIAVELAPRMTPGRLAFIQRLERKERGLGRHLLLLDPSQEVSALIAATENADARNMLRKTRTEINMGLGVFFLTGSLSGWICLLILGPRMIRRSLLHGKNQRIDFFFDLVERSLIYFGRRALQLAYAGRPPQCTA